jgi:hypothetical protein
MGAPEERLAEQQKLFRLANERLHQRTAAYGKNGTLLVPFLCECADVGCLGRVELTHRQYREIRSHPDRYVIQPGHPIVEHERIIEEHDSFHIVEKGSLGRQ